MALVSFSSLWNNHPYPANPCDTTAFSNQCAIRMGVALERSGVDTSSFDTMFPNRRCYPNFGHNPRHILAAQELADWLETRTGVVGTPTKRSNVTSADYQGRKGIVFIQDGWGATDHIDLWNGEQLKAGALGYFALGRQVWFWDLTASPPASPFGALAAGRRALANEKAVAAFAADRAAGNLIQNGDFESGSMGTWWASPAVSPSVGGGVLTASITNPGTNAYDAIVGQHGLSLLTGTRYRVSFRARANRVFRFLLSIQKPIDPWTPYLTKLVDLSTDWQTFEYEFSPSQSDMAASFQFQIGGQGVATLTIDDVVVEVQGAVPTGAVEEFDANFARVPAGEYVYENNGWGFNKLQSGETFQQSILRKTNGTTTLGWKWNWPSRVDSSVYSYPEAVFGRKPWNDIATTSLLPRRIDSMTSATLEYDVTQTIASGVYNLAPEIWLVERDTEVVPRGIRAELMFWMDYRGATPAGNRVEQVVVGGRAFDVYVADLTDAASGARWRYLAFLAMQREPNRASLPLLEFIKYGVQRGHYPNTYYLASVELGNEISSGQGETWVNHFDVRIV